MKLRLIAATAFLATGAGLLDATPVGAARAASESQPASPGDLGLSYSRSAGRKDCPLGKVYSSYHRRCVWWLPIRT